MTSGVQEARQERKPIAAAGNLVFRQASQDNHVTVLEAYLR